jgi:hypothetical protein
VKTGQASLIVLACSEEMARILKVFAGFFDANFKSFSNILVQPLDINKT